MELEKPVTPRAKREDRASKFMPLLWIKGERISGASFGSPTPFHALRKESENVYFASTTARVLLDEPRRLIASV